MVASASPHVADDLDETIEETFPASDAPGNTPETGIRIDPASDAAPPEPLTEEERPRQETVGSVNVIVVPAPGALDA